MELDEQEALKFAEELVLGGGAPQYDMPYSEPEYYTTLNKFSIDS